MVTTTGVLGRYASDLIHASVVLVICILATVYSTVTRDHSGNIWIVYGSAIAYAAGRSGAAVAGQLIRRHDDGT